jgi:hypothetical protein
MHRHGPECSRPPTTESLLTRTIVGVRTADGLYRFFGRNRFGSVVGMSAHRFDDGVDAAAQEAALKAWLDGVYA